MTARILIVEDEIDLARILADYLYRENLTVQLMSDGNEALAAIRKAPPDLLLLDLMLPGLDGLSILREVRKTLTLPVILVTARVEEIDRLLGLELGADDYICKPYSPREVVARVKAILRRVSSPAKGGAVPAGGERLVIDPAAWAVSCDGRRIDLTPKEFRLLATLASSAGRVYSRGQLLDALYADNFEVSERAVDSHMKNLRKKLAQALPEHEAIRSIYGVGFVFEAPPDH